MLTNFKTLLIFSLGGALFWSLTFSFALKVMNQALASTPQQKSMVSIPKGSYLPLYRLEESEQAKSQEQAKGSAQEAAKLLKEERTPILVEAFFLDRVPVSLEDYLSFVIKHTEWRKSKVRRIFADTSYLKGWRSDVQLPLGQSPKSPVTNVSWFAARAYCEAQGKRLPTLDEWEYVASSYPPGVDVKKEILRWYSEPTPAVHQEVGSTFPNAFGVYDLHGLIWEWVEDFNSNLVTGESRADVSLERSQFCGSSGLGANDFEDYPAFMRFGFRSSLSGNFALNNLGFRCARSTTAE